MKRVGLFMLMALLGLCIVSAVPVSATVIYSSGFNTDTDSNGIADGWSALQPSGSSTFQLNTSNKNEGAASQECDPVAWKGIISDSISGIVPGRAYIISYWVAKLSGSTVEIRGEGKLNSYCRVISSSGSWVHIQDAIIASNTSDPAKIAIDGYTDGAGFRIDDLKIEEMLPTVIYSSGFNTDTDSNGIADGWSALSGSGSSTFWLETSNKTEGAASQGCDPIAWKGIISNSISGVVTGRTYIISYWVTKLSGSTVEIWGDGKLDDYYRVITSSGSWVYVEDAVVASDNVNPAQLAVDGHSDGAGFLIDDLKIEELPPGVVYTSRFNADADGNGITDGWSALSGSEGSTFWMETSNKNEGRASQGCDPVPWKGIISGSISGIVPGRTYNISYWVTKLSGSTVEIWGDGKLDSYYRAISSSGSWVYVEDTVVASSNANPAQLAVDGHSAGASFLIDYLKIEEVPSAVIYSSDFNFDTDSNGITDGWSALSGSGSSTFWMETLWDQVREGVAAQGCDPIAYKGIISDSISGITTGQAYTIKYWITKLTGSTVEIWGDGKLDSYYTTVSTPTGWVYKQDLVTASSNANPAQLAVDGYSDGAGFLVDYMKIEQGDTRVDTGTLTGQVELLDFSGDVSLAPVRVKVVPHERGKTQWTDVFTLDSNPFTYTIVGPIVPGIYDVEFTSVQCLKKTFTNVVLGSGENVLNAQMINGDVNGDNSVTSADQNIVHGNLGMTGD